MCVYLCVCLSVCLSLYIYTDLNKMYFCSVAKNFQGVRCEEVEGEQTETIWKLSDPASEP